MIAHIAGKWKFKRTNCCTSLHVLGVHVDGGMAEYYCHPADMLVKMPDDMDWTDAAMGEPLTISLHGIHRGGLKAGERDSDSDGCDHP